MANFPIISFNGGKATPLIDVRSDTEKFSSLCREMQNMIPRIYGPAERTPGTKFIAEVEDNAIKSRMIPFIFSADIAYDLEFSKEVINVYFDGTFITSVVSPYQEADLFQIQFKQSADVMWLTHNSYNPYKLSRTSASTFSLDKIQFENGPFKKRNDLSNADDVELKVTGYTIDTTTPGSPGVFTIESATDISGLFGSNQRLWVSASGTNNRGFTVNESIATTYVGTTVTITTNETVDGGGSGGQIHVDGGVATLTANALGVFTTGDEGSIDSLWKLTHKRREPSTSGSATSTGIIGRAIDIKGNWTFTTTGNWGATVEIQRLADGTNWETFRTYVSTISSGQGSFNAQKSDVEDATGVQYRIYVTSYTGGTVEATLQVDESTQDGIYKITNVIDSATSTVIAVIASSTNRLTKRWAEGSWSFPNGWPASITFFEERAVYGFTNLDTRDVWNSGTNEFEDFETGTNDNDAFTVTLPTANKGRWLGSSEALTAGTSGDEWRIMSTNFSEGITPENVSVKLQTSFGSTDIQALEVNEALIFIDKVGRKIREYTWADPKQKFVSPDLTALAEDITCDGVTSMAVQKRPDNIVWFTLANSPYLITMTYNREQNVVAFAEHPMGDGIAESISIRPGDREDVITMTVKRTINGQAVRHIEEMQPRDWGEDTDIFFVQDGIIDTSGSTTITGLDHLEGETVQVMADGAQQADKIVDGGQITIDEAGTRVVVGLPYEYRLSPMRLDTTTAKGTTHGSIKKASELVMSFYKTLNAKFGDGVDQYDINWRTTENYDNPPNLFTGDIVETFDGGFTTEDNIVISGSDPFPCTVRALIPRFEVTGR